jgi:transcriptional regulator with XRE-family HTH domain
MFYGSFVTRELIARVDELQQRFGELLRRRRLAAKLSQERLAERAGVHFTTISLVERGKMAPTIIVVRKLAVALDTTMAELMGELEEALVDKPKPNRKK